MKYEVIFNYGENGKVEHIGLIHLILILIFNRDIKDIELRF